MHACRSTLEDPTHANDVVSISASHIQVGQDFRQPQNPEDQILAFQNDPAFPTPAYFLPPTSGGGNLKLDACLIDVGTLSLQNIGRAFLTADGGDIRGNGTLGMAGDLFLKAAQIYPTTLGKFDIFAYDHDGVAGSVTIRRSGFAAAPLSAGGGLSVYASRIDQGGVLRAPLGTIRLGWDGTDLDPSDADLDTPYDLIAGTTIAVPVTSLVTLGEGSLTSVSAKGLQIPYGISPDGTTWIDPSGVNITLSGLPEKSVFVSGDSVDMRAGATVNIEGGGDLFATRWVAGNGGSRDLLGAASVAWGSGTEYQPGDLVTYRGQTWSARVRHAGQTPGANLYWSAVSEAFAIVPEFNAKFAPYAAYNTGANAGALAGNPGYVSGSLKAGDTITLDGSDGLPAGTYTLLPRAYANMKGAFLVTPVDLPGSGSVKAADGANFVSGYLANNFDRPAAETSVRQRFEIASSDVVKGRVAYEVYSADKFIGKAGGKSLLPVDAGYAAFHGNTGLSLSGSLLAASAGRGAKVDVSSFSDIRLTGADGAAGSPGEVSLDAGVLGSWGVESLLVGGIRTRGADGTRVDVRTGSLTLDNPGEVLSGPEIILASKGTLRVTSGSAIASTGKSTAPAGKLLVDGDGALLRVSADPTAEILRGGLAGSADPLLEIAASASVSGTSVILDSSYGTLLSPEANIDSRFLTLGSGQISVVFDDASLPLEGSVIAPHLTLAGVTLDNVRKSEALTLLSYRTIDFYGSGTLGGPKLDSITLSGAGVRGYRQGDGGVTVSARDVRFENPVDVVPGAAPADRSGSLTIAAETVRLGVNDVAVSGYDSVALQVSRGVLFDGDGSFGTAGNLKIDSPMITGAGGTTYAIRAAGTVKLSGDESDGAIAGGLGASLTVQGERLSADAAISLPSGQLTLRATGGPLEVGGNLSVAGSFRKFDDLIRFSDAGSITLESLTGDVTIAAGGTVSVAGSAMGGNAGTLAVHAANGVFADSGKLSGDTAAAPIGNDGWTTGSFSLDVGSLGGSGMTLLDGIRKSLDAGGFLASRSFRIRNGDVTITGDHHSHAFQLSADRGSIRIEGAIDASGATGGAISLAAHGNLVLASGAELNASAARFDSAGKGGSILLEAGTQLDGIANDSASLSLETGSRIFLGVEEYVAGSYIQPGSSAFEGKFTGTLHLRAPRTAGNDDLGVGAIGSDIAGASAVVVEGYKIYQPSGGVMNIALRNKINADSIAFLGASGVGNANGSAIHDRLLGGAANAAALDPLLVLAPGVEILNLSGDLTLGLANPTGSTSQEALAAADWDLSGFRYGSRGAAGVLTLRAAGDVVFNNTLSDGFVPIAQGSAQVFADNGNSLLWLATLDTIKASLPVNTQSWSYRLTAGADLASADYRSVLSAGDLDLAQPGKGSVIVGEFYPEIPNSQSFGTAAGIGSNGQTADTIRISTTTTNRGNRFEVVRTGTGDITVSAGRDVQLRNQFSTIYTAGVALPDPTTIFSAGDFVVPALPTRSNGNPNQSGGASGTLGAAQQLYPAAWSMAGGNVSLSAQANIGRYTMINGVLTLDSSRQLPTNWLYRRGYVDSSTGLFASDGGVDSDLVATRITDTATSTTWWVDYSNFFEGVGALGGGNVSLVSGNDIVNVDAVAPTNARMPGRKANPDFNGLTDAPEYLNVAPDASKLVELGGGDVTVRAGHNIDGGAYYVERGKGVLFAGADITTNAARSPSLGILDGTQPLDPLTWLPTTLFVGTSSFDVAARGDVLLGPVTNPFMLPQGLNNRFWYKSYFNTYSSDAGANVASYGGSVTHRMAVNLPGGASATPILNAWYNTQDLFTGDGSSNNASFYQPWLRLAELGLTSFNQVFSLTAPNLTSTAFGGDLNLVGSWTLAPSATGDLELVASGGIIGLQETGPGLADGGEARIWTSSTINISDASPALLPSIAAPVAYQSVAGRDRVTAVQSVVNILQNTDNALAETGSFKDAAGASSVKQALHAAGLLHREDPNPVRLHAAGFDITGLTLFSPKETRITAGRDITDVSFYLQNVGKSDISLVSAGRDIVPFDENSDLREIANNISLGNAVGDVGRKTAAGNSTSALAGDIQINGPGVLEVLAGHDIDLGTGANFTDGTGTGITSIGNNRNPSLPFGGADLLVLGGLGRAADGLSGSDLDFAGFIRKYLPNGATAGSSAYLAKLGWSGDFDDLTEEQQAIVALEKFYKLLRDAGRDAAEKGNYDSGYAAVRKLFGKAKPAGDVLTRAREIRTTSGGSISLALAGGDITMASDIFGNPLTPPGIVTEYGGSISTFTDGDVNIGQARIFTLRGGDITMWSSNGDIAAGTSPKTVVTAPPTRVVIDITSADVQTDLGGLATGGGIGVLASVTGVKAGNVDLVAPNGTVDAGDAGIRVTGNLNIAAQVVLNSSNISAGGVTTGASPGAVSAPSAASVTTASNASAAATASVTKPGADQQPAPAAVEPVLSVITVEVIGYGGGGNDEDEDKDHEKQL